MSDLKKQPKEILLIFKTHLDIGFTDYAENIVKNYLEVFIPNAIRVGNALRETDTPFVWTVGSWMIWEALKHDRDGVVEKAIRDGIIAWHALPFTTHTELMNKTLFEYGLSLSQQLDQRFERKTIAAKMTDVPGHTIGIVPLMADHGVEFLHLGVNPATPVPEVPPAFRWRNGEKEIVVMYQGDYGELEEFDNFILCFAHTHDNTGPQSTQEVIQIYEELRSKYPGHPIKAATLNDVAEKMRHIDGLPVIEKEIGDSWIHGAGTDPAKVSMYRQLLRYIEERGIDNKDISDNLLLVPEHTWGRDIKKCFKFQSDAHYFPDEFEQVNSEARADAEKSWLEQRNYVERAAEVLGVSLEKTVEMPDLAGFTEIEPEEPHFEISWQLFDRKDYERYQKIYMRTDVLWAIWDFTKVGLPEYEGGIFTPKVTRAFSDGNKKCYRLDFTPAQAQQFGLPVFWVEEVDGSVDVKWFGKKANRLPQAFWLKFKNQKESWQLHKLGQWIRAEDVIGSPLIAAIDKGVRNEDTQIESLDAPLVAPYGRRLLDFDLHQKKQDLYFNLYNNIWNTNFPMWYSDDSRFRFQIKRR